LSCCHSRLAPPSVPTRRSSDLASPWTTQPCDLTRGVLSCPCLPRVANGHWGVRQAQPGWPHVARPVPFNRALRGHLLLGRKVGRDRKSTRLNSSHVKISYAVFC